MRKIKRGMIRAWGRVHRGHAGILLGLVMFFSGMVPAAGQITLDTTAGTNTVALVTSSMTASANLILPIVLGVLLIAGCIGMYKRLARKGGVGT